MLTRSEVREDACPFTTKGMSRRAFAIFLSLRLVNPGHGNFGNITDDVFFVGCNIGNYFFLLNLSNISVQPGVKNISAEMFNVLDK